MTPISAIAPMKAYATPAMVAPVETPARGTEVQAERKVAEHAPTALPVSDMSRLVMDVRAGYECGTKVERVGDKARDFDRLGYVLEGFEHTRNIIALQKAEGGESLDMVL